MATMNIEEKTFEDVKKALTKLASLARDARRSTEKSDMESVLELIETELQEIRDVLLIEAEPARRELTMEWRQGEDMSGDRAWKWPHENFYWWMPENDRVRVICESGHNGPVFLIAKGDALELRLDNVHPQRFLDLRPAQLAAEAFLAVNHEEQPCEHDEGGEG